MRQAEQPITKVSVSFFAVPKGKRKLVRLKHEADKIEGHVRLTPEQLNQYERQFWSWAKSQGFKEIDQTATIFVNHGGDDGAMVFVKMLPEQQQTIMRGN